jgi:hypothetical protein
MRDPLRHPLALLGGLFLLLIVGLVLVPPASERQIPLTVYSAEPSGGKALRLWLEALGRSVTTIEGEKYEVPRNVGTLLLLDPTTSLSRDEAATLEQWTRNGGRLVVADRGVETSGLLRRFGVTVRPLSTGFDTALPASNGRLDPHIGTVPVDTSVELQIEQAAGAVPLLLGQRADAEPSPDQDQDQETEQHVLAAWVPAGRGELIVLATPDLLSNQSLRAEPNARLALSLVGVNDRGGVAFDEVHHGFGAVRARTLYDLLLEQAWGRTLFLAAGVVLTFLLIRGRRFGRTVPVFVDRGRSLGELVTSQAALYRAGGKRAFAADHLARQLRGEYTQDVGLPASATDGEIEARARALGRDAGPALLVLRRVQRARTDRDLLGLAREGAHARAKLGLSARAPNGRRPAFAGQPDRTALTLNPAPGGSGESLSGGQE